MKPKPPPKYRILHIMATNRPDVLDDALLRPGRLDRIYKVGYPHVDGRRRTYEGYLDKVKHELTAGPDRPPGGHLAVRHRRHDQGHRQRGADHRHARRSGHHHVGRHAEGQAPQDPRHPGRLDLRGPRAPPGGHPRGLPRGGHVPAAEALDHRRRHHRAARRHRRLRRADAPGGALHRVAQRVRDQRQDVPGLAGRRADAVRGRQLGRRRWRPLQRHPHRDGDPGVLGHGPEHRLARGHQGPAGWGQLPAGGRNGPEPAGDHASVTRSRLACRS